MIYKTKIANAVLLFCTYISGTALADCVIPESTKQLDPVEVGVCESDAVFVGKVVQRLETVRAYRPEGSDKTSHFKVEHSTVKVGNTYKGNLPENVTLIADLYVPEGAYSFQLSKEYLIFAKKISEENAYSGASAQCARQPTLPIENAKKVIAQLEAHKKGQKKIDCGAIKSRQ